MPLLSTTSISLSRLLVRPISHTMSTMAPTMSSGVMMVVIMKLFLRTRSLNSLRAMSPIFPMFR